MEMEWRVECELTQRANNSGVETGVVSAVSVESREKWRVDWTVE